MSFDVLFRFLITPEFVGAYCVLIGLYFVVALSSLYGTTRAVRKRLNESREVLLPPPGRDPKKAFAKTFDERRSKMEEYFGRPWREFEETLIEPSPGSESQIFHSPHAASLYFNSSTLFEQTPSFVSSRSIPNLLTGIGILGTFIGLAAGVGAAQSGLSSGTPDEITESLQQLLRGASLAFLTSIVGIGCSIVFTLGARRFSGSLTRGVDEWVKSLESCLERTTTEKIAGKQLGQLSEVAGGIKRFNTDLVFALETALGWESGAVEQARIRVSAGERPERLDALPKKIAEKLSPDLKSLTKRMDALREERATDAGQMITEALSRFTTAMQERTGSQFDEMAGVVADLNRTLEKSADRMAESQRDVREALDLVVRKVTTSMNDSASAMTQALGSSLTAVNNELTDASRKVAANMTDSSNAAAKKLRDAVVSATQGLTETGVEAASRITGSTKSLEDAAEQLSSASRRNREVLDDAAAFVKQLNQLRSTIEITHRSISDLAAPIRTAASQIRESTDQTAGALTEASGLVALINEAVDTLGRHEEAVASAWTDYQDRFEGIDESLADVFRQIDDGLSGYCEQVKRFANELDDKTANTVQQLAAATHELSQSIDDLTEHLGVRT